MSTKNKSQNPGPIRRSLVAAASLLTGKKVDSRTPVTQEASWQADAEDMYDLVGELRFLADMLAGRAGKAKIYIGRVTDQNEFGDPVPVDEDDSANVMDLLGGEKNLSKMVERYTQNEYVLGEGWVVGVPRALLTPSIVDESAPTVRISPFTGEGEDVQEGPDLEDMEFRLLSVREIKFTDDDTLILDWDSPASENGKLEVREQDIYSFRIWRAHPMRYLEANSPTRAILPTLRELVGLTMHISAQIDSRLSGAGVFFVLQSAMNAMADGQDGEDLDFITALIDAMVTPIKDRSSAAAVVPLVVPVPDDGSGRAASDYAHLQTFATPFDEKTGELRDEAIRRTALGADAPPEVLLGTGCVDTETEILTRRGWQALDTFREGDEVLTLNKDTGLSEWQQPTALNVYERVDEPMLRMSGKGHSSLTTMNHRWLTTSANHARREFVTSDALNTGHLIPTAAPHAGLPTEAKHSDAFVELVGWFWTEGSFTFGTEAHIKPYVDSIGRVFSNGHSGHTGKWGQASIAQSFSKNPDRVDRIRAALDTVFPGGWGTETMQTGEWGSDVVRFNLRKHVYEALAEVGGKTVTLDFIQSLTAAQLELFIQTSCAGDGWHNSDGRLDIWQRDGSALDAYELALILSGRTTTRTQHAGGWVVNAIKKSTVRPIKAGIEEETTYTGTVWCPSTPNGTWFARRDGTSYFTGNSMNHWGAWLVKEETITTHVEPPLERFTEGLTTAFLWPVLRAQGMTEEQARQYVFTYSVRHLIVRANRTSDAETLHEAGVISDEAFRREGGFDDSDAPKETDPAILHTLMLIEKDPDLARDPGAGAVLEQMRALLAGQVIDAPETAQAPPEEPGGSEGDNPSEDIPQTQDDDATAPEEDM